MRRKFFTPKDKYYTNDMAKAAAVRFCTYQERCYTEVKAKLADMRIYGDQAEQLILELMEEDVLNEERFARAYARGKFRLKEWGKVRITRELKARKISDYCIKKGLSELDEYDYYGTLLTFIERKDKFLDESNPWNRRRKLTDMAIRRGFEMELIYAAIKEVLGEITSTGWSR